MDVFVLVYINIVNKESINNFNASSDNINKVLLVPSKYELNFGAILKVDFSAIAILDFSLSLFQLCDSKSCYS